MLSLDLQRSADLAFQHRSPNLERGASQHQRQVRKEMDLSWETFVFTPRAALYRRRRVLLPDSRAEHADNLLDTLGVSATPCDSRRVNPHIPPVQLEKVRFSATSSSGMAKPLPFCHTDSPALEMRPSTLPLSWCSKASQLRARMIAHRTKDCPCVFNTSDAGPCRTAEAVTSKRASNFKVLVRVKVRRKITTWHTASTEGVRYRFILSSSASTNIF